MCVNSAVPSHRVISLQCKARVHIQLQQSHIILVWPKLPAMPKQELVLWWYRLLLGNCSTQVTQGLLVPYPACGQEGVDLNISINKMDATWIWAKEVSHHRFVDVVLSIRCA